LFFFFVKLDSFRPNRKRDTDLDLKATVIRPIEPAPEMRLKTTHGKQSGQRIIRQ